MSTANSEIIKPGELHAFSLRMAYSKIPIGQLKISAQRLKEDIDWRGRHEYAYECYEAIMYVIHIADPKFETKYVPAK